jgi:predicted transcriptional regulator
MKNTFLSIRLSAKLIASIDALARKQLRTRSNMVEYLLRECMALHKEELDEIAEKQ